MTKPGADAAQLAEGIKNRDLRTLARVITLIENHGPQVDRLLTDLHSLTGRAHRVGITGPPGAGKSTLVQGIASEFRRRHRTVGVIAVDPTSPITGGALLGDRVRMDALALDPGVYIRSMASRGAVGGIALSTLEACDVLDAFGFDIVLVETVGVGQAELAVTGSADTTVLVLVPESGDEVQVLKAGVIEVADIFVVNKSDRPDARLLVTELLDTLKMKGPAAETDADGWIKPVLPTVATTQDGVRELVDELERHRAYLEATGERADRRRRRLTQHVRDVTERLMQEGLWAGGVGQRLLDEHLDRVASGDLSAYEVARMILERYGERD